MYDALNVLSAMDIIRKDKYNIIYNHHNEHIPADFGFDSDSDEAVGDGKAVPCEGLDDDSNQVDVLAQNFTLSNEMIDEREAAVLVQRNRIRDKQKLFLELVK